MELTVVRRSERPCKQGLGPGLIAVVVDKGHPGIRGSAEVVVVIVAHAGREFETLEESIVTLRVAGKDRAVGGRVERRRGDARIVWTVGHVVLVARRREFGRRTRNQGHVLNRRVAHVGVEAMAHVREIGMSVLAIGEFAGRLQSWRPQQGHRGPPLVVGGEELGLPCQSLAEVVVVVEAGDYPGRLPIAIGVHDVACGDEGRIHLV